ncbi:MAG: molybdopterin synthase catalytic subunit [Gammaproteobacteria bacterium]|jgi:molybdopterin synthase catalytic subunit
MMPIEIRSSSFDPWDEIKLHQQKMNQKMNMTGQYGATASFIGTMRDFNEGESVQSMTLEHYPGMTEKHLEEICRDANEQWNLLDTLILHRIGEIQIADPIVLVCVWSAHRAEAFDACRFIMEDLKSKAPFWKQESIESGKRWVDKNTPG